MQTFGLVKSVQVGIPLDFFDSAHIDSTKRRVDWSAVDRARVLLARSVDDLFPNATFEMNTVESALVDPGLTYFIDVSVGYELDSTSALLGVIDVACHDAMFGQRFRMKPRDRDAILPYERVVSHLDVGDTAMREAMVEAAVEPTRIRYVEDVTDLAARYTRNADGVVDSMTFFNTAVTGQLRKITYRLLEEVDAPARVA